MNSSLVHTKAIDDGLDRQNIAILKKRFLAINEERLERMRGALSDRAQLFMDVLPLLFHCNHPMMPGFVSRQTPARICHYKPSKRDVLVGKMVAKSFTLTYDPSADDEIYGIYIMGSVGTIAQSEGSDLDIWICHKPGMERRAIDELQKKCEKITAWAEDMRLEAHFFLMDHEAFKAQKSSRLNKESSGSAQHLLLLDEFYRTAIFIAGRVPIWWFVPPISEDVFKEYTNTLLYKRFLPTDSVLDFGGVANIPAGEFLGAGIWQLYKAIESPYKSVLKLLLLEAYVSEYPNICPLSLTYKAMIYEGVLDIDALDSYAMIYRRIEHYLTQKNQTKRLDLARRCFYFKVNKKLSRPPTTHAKSWQRIYMEELCADWGWDLDYIRKLDNRKTWKAATVSEEKKLLVTELTHGYRFLVEFANSSAKSRSISSEELIVLGRKLQAAFERKPGKIDWVNPGISSDISESVIVFSEVHPKDTKETYWIAEAHEAGVALSNQGTIVKSGRELIELVLWCYFNGVITQTTRLELSNTEQLSTLELRRLLSAFSEWLPLPLEQLSHGSFQRPAVQESVLFLINAGKSATPDLDNRGYQRMSGKTDALRYGSFEENLVASVDMVIKNSWNELFYQRFEGEQALIDTIIEYLNMTLPGTHHVAPKTQVLCIGSSHASTITQRVNKWLSEITSCFFTGRDAKYKRFIFQLSGNNYCMQFKGMKPHVHAFSNVSHLIEHLEQTQSQFSPLVIDSHAFRDHPLRIIALGSRKKSIDIFFCRFDIGIEIYVSDEKGSIIHHLYRGRRNHNILRPLHRFLRSILYRQAQSDPDFSGDFGIFPIHFVEIHRDNHGHLSAKNRNVQNDLPKDFKLDLRAEASKDSEGKLCYNFYCDGQEFTQEKFGPQLELVISQYIISRRQQNDNYPVYISDLDLNLAADIINPNGPLQIVHYLRIKNRLESKLNQAIGILVNA